MKKFFILLLSVIVSNVYLSAQTSTSQYSDTTYMQTAYGSSFQDLNINFAIAHEESIITNVRVEIFEIEKQRRQNCHTGNWAVYTVNCNTSDNYAYDLIAYGDTVTTICGGENITNWNGLSPNTIWKLHFKTLGNCIYRFKIAYKITIEYLEVDCIKPSGLLLQDISINSAIIAWTEQSSNTEGYEYVLSTVNTVPNNIGTYHQNTSINLSNLSENTTYYFWVRAICDNQIKSDWTGPLVMTTSNNENCLPPTNISTTYINAHTATIVWSESVSLPSQGYLFHNSPNSQNPSVMGTPVLLNTITLNNLDHSSMYYFWIRSVCDEGIYSVWGNPYLYKTDCEAIETLNENFDLITKPSLPLCWTVTTGDVSTTSLSAYSLPNSLLLKIDDIEGISTSIVATPSISDIMLKRLRFRAKIESGSLNKLHIGTISNPNDPEEFYTISTLTLNTSWNEYVVDFDISIENNNYIAFKYEGNLGDYGFLYIDNINILNAPTCIEPTSVQITNISTSSAEINWTSSANAWNIEYGASGFTIGTGTQVQAQNKPIIIEGLSDQTSYDIYIQTICSQEPYITSVWSGPFSFSTICNNFDVPFFENFELVSPNTIPICWTTTTGIISTANMSSLGLNAISGSNALSMTSSGSNEIPYPMLTTPHINQNIQSLRIRFWALYKDMWGGNAQLQIGTISQPENFSTFKSVATISADGIWKQHTIYFDEYTGSNNHISFRLIGNVAQGYLYLDDIIVEVIPECLEPVNIFAENITHNSFDLIWNSIGNENKWNVKVGLPGFTPESNQEIAFIQNIANTFLSVSNLESNSGYDVYIQSKCSETLQSAWTGPISITTLCDPADFWSLDLYEHFETNSATRNCWVMKNISGNKNWVVQSGQNQTPNGSFSAYHTYGVNEESILLSHDILLPIDGSIYLSFMYRTHNLGGYGQGSNKNSLQISTNGGITFTELWTTNEAFEFWESVENIDLSSYAGETVKIGFRYKGLNFSHEWFVDEIRIQSPANIKQIQNQITQVWEYDNILHVRPDDNETIKIIKVYNIIGSVVLESNKLETSLHKLSQGIYVASVVTDKRIINKKILVK
jgi:hypothetical protein